MPQLAMKFLALIVATVLAVCMALTAGTRVLLGELTATDQYFWGSQVRILVFVATQLAMGHTPRHAVSHPRKRPAEGRFS